MTTTFRASRNSPESLQEKFESKGNFQKKFAKKKGKKDMIREDLEPQPEAKKSFRDTVREENPRMFADMVDKEVRKFISNNLTALELDPSTLDKAVSDSMDLIYGALGSPYMTTNPSVWKSQALFGVEHSMSDTIYNTTTSVVGGLADYYRQLLITQKEIIVMNQANNTQANNTSSEMPHITITPTAGVEDATINKETTRSAVDTAVNSVMAKAADTGAAVDEAAVRSAFSKVGAMAEEATVADYSVEEIEEMITMMAASAEAEAQAKQPQPEPKVEPKPQPTPEPEVEPQPKPQQAKAALKVEEGYSTLQKTAMWVGGAIAVGVVGYGIYRLVKSGDVETATKTAEVLGNVSAAAASALSDFA